jgi:choice-of-anchor C domain-containing protein
MKKILIAAVCAAAVSLGATASNAAVAIINGSFEDGTFDPGAFSTLGLGSTAITGWVVGGLGVDYIGTYWEAADGTRSVDLSGNDKGSISQMLNGLTIGQTYQVTFSLAGNPDGGSSTKVAVASDGGSQSSVYAFLQGGNTKSSMGWTPQSFTFTATGESANLTFSASENDAYGPALDNVGIAAVPEPATWAMMILGFGVVGATVRGSRRRQAIAAA